MASQIYSVEQVAEALKLSVEGVKNYRKRNPTLFLEGTHYVRDKGTIFYLAAGIAKIRELRGESGEIEPAFRSELALEPVGSEPLDGSVLELLSDRLRPLLEPLAEPVLAGSLRAEFEDILVAKLLDVRTPLTPAGCAEILRRNGLLPVDFSRLPEED